MYKGCDFRSMVENYYKQHPEEAEETGLKIYQNNGVIDEMTESEAYKIAKNRTQVSSGGEQMTRDKHKKKKRV